MVAFEDYVKVIEKDTNDIMEALVEGSIYLQENQIDALQTQAAWVVAAKLRRYLETYLSIEISLNLVWDSWLEYHTLKYGNMTAQLLKELHSIEYADSIAAFDPSEIDENTDPSVHYFLYMMQAYNAPKVTIHSLQSKQQEYRMQYLFDIQNELAANRIDMSTDAIMTYLDLLEIQRTFDELMVTDYSGGEMNGLVK